MDWVLKAEVAYDNISSEYSMKHLCMAKHQLSDKLEIQERYWKQKDNIKWLKEGDNNTKFFHQSVKIRRQKLSISRIRDTNGLWLTEQEEIANEAINAFQTQLNQDPIKCDKDLLEHIPASITSEQRKAMEAPPN